MTQLILSRLAQLFNFVKKVKLGETGAEEEPSEVTKLEELGLGQQSPLSCCSLEMSSCCCCWLGGGWTSGQAGEMRGAASCNKIIFDRFYFQPEMTPIVEFDPALEVMIKWYSSNHTQTQTDLRFESASKNEICCTFTMCNKIRFACTTSNK